MSKEYVIFPHVDGTISILILGPCGLSTQEIARKDVPDGVPYKIVQAADMPADWDFSEAWEVDFSNPDGFGVGHQKWFAERGIQI